MPGVIISDRTLARAIWKAERRAGLPGPEGPEGPEGSSGIPGSVITAGPNPPLSSTGSAGDVHLLEDDIKGVVLQTYQKGAGFWDRIGDVNTPITENSSLTSSGYVRLQNGLIIQWGTDLAGDTGSANGVGDYTINFPISFDNMVFTVAVTPLNADPASSISAGVVSFDGAHLRYTLSIIIATGAHSPANTRVYWLALGY
jgi:hypothetical protein